MKALLEPAQLRSIESLRLVPRKTFSGSTRGERLTNRRGISIDFADYRSYAEGDDLRHVDWNILARLDQAVTKTYRDEQDLYVYLLLDCSASMDFGEPNKFETAQRLAWCLAYIALVGGDVLQATDLRPGGRPTPVMRGRRSVHRAAAWIGGQVPDGTNAPSENLRQFLKSRAAPGLVVLVTDCMDPELPAVLHAVGGRGHDLLVLQVLSDVERDPDIEGDLRLLDAESGRSVELTANALALDEYARRFKSHQEAVEAAVTRAGGRFLSVGSGDAFADVVNSGFKRFGWVRT